MRRWILVWIVVLFVGVAFAPFPLAHAQDEPYPISLSAGETFDVCSSGQIVCPARNTICDDPKVALPVDVPNGLGFKGIAREQRSVPRPPPSARAGSSASPCTDRAAGDDQYFRNDFP